MGWASGTGLFADIAEVIANSVTNDDERRTVYDAMIEAFIEYDCDTLDECLGIDHVLDAALSDILELDSDTEDDD